MFILLWDTRRFAGTHNERRCKVFLNPASRVEISKRNQRMVYKYLLFQQMTRIFCGVQANCSHGGPLYKSKRALINLGSDTARWHSSNAEWLEPSCWGQNSSLGVGNGWWILLWTKKCISRRCLAGRDSACPEEKSARVYHETSDRSQSNPTEFASKSREFLSTPLSASAKGMSPLKRHLVGEHF